MNTLYCGDNLKVRREQINDEFVDLIYLDPPFNSNRSYNVLFKDESGMPNAQITAFDIVRCNKTITGKLNYLVFTKNHITSFPNN